MKRVNMDGVTGYAERETLPLGNGGYVLRILGATEKQNTIGTYLEISCDIAEGEYKDFFMRDYKAQPPESKKWRCTKFVNVPNDDGSERDEWSKRGLKTLMDALEESNPGYHWDWDEGKLKGKIVGGLFREEEFLGNFDNNVHVAVRLGGFTSADKIRKGDFRKMNRKPLRGDAYEAPAPHNSGFTAVPDDDLPF